MTKNCGKTKSCYLNSQEKDVPNENERCVRRICRIISDWIANKSEKIGLDIQRTVNDSIKTGWKNYY